MKSLAKLTFGALVLTGAALTTAQPANAASSFSFSYGYGGGYGGPHVSVHYNPCYRPIMGGRAIAIIRSIAGGFSSAAPGITVRSTIATTAEAANIGMAGAGIAARCMRAQDCAETSPVGTMVMVPGAVWGAVGAKARRLLHPSEQPATRRAEYPGPLSKRLCQVNLIYSEISVNCRWLFSAILMGVIHPS